MKVDATKFTEVVHTRCGTAVYLDGKNEFHVFLRRGDCEPCQGVFETLQEAFAYKAGAHAAAGEDCEAVSPADYNATWDEIESGEEGDDQRFLDID